MNKQTEIKLRKTIRKMISEQKLDENDTTSIKKGSILFKKDDTPVRINKDIEVEILKSIDNNTRIVIYKNNRYKAIDKYLKENKLNEAYTVNVYQSGRNMDDSAYDTKDKLIDSFSFDTKPEAEKKHKELIKQYKLTKQNGFYGNSKSGIEVDKNY